MRSTRHVLALGAFAALVGATPNCSECALYCTTSVGYPEPPAPSCEPVTVTVPGCCPAPVTVTETVKITETTTDTVYTTDVSTQIHVSVSTDYSTETVVKTTSYPVTVTTSVCTGPAASSPEPTGYPTGYPDTGYPVPDTEEDCVYYTTTVWQTTTVEETVYVPSIVPSTVTHISTDRSTETLTHISTDRSTETLTHVSTDRSTEISTYTSISTYTTTYTYVSVVPTTVVSDHTEYVTTTYTTVSTFTEEVIITDTVTDTDTDTVTLPGSVTTLPGSVTTLPGETITTVTTTTLPASTVTITEDGTTVTTVVPGPTSVITTTVVIPPTTVTLPPTTVTERPPVTVCPAPTNVAGVNPDIPFDFRSNRTWGCDPGYVCNPPKPEGCNLWADSPADDYVCCPQDCVKAPPYSVVRWQEDETSYFPPNDGYFNLNPNAFGLPFSIFEYETIVKKKHGQTWTITTGNWASATELTAFPPTHTDFVKRQEEGEGETIAPAVCFDDCNRCYIEAESVGKSPALCVAGSPFRTDYALCVECIDLNAEDGAVTRRRYTEEKFSQFLRYCDAQEAIPITTSSISEGPIAPSAVTSDPDVSTTSASPGETDTPPEPIDPTTTSSSESSEAESSVPTPPSTAESTSEPTSSSESSAAATSSSEAVSASSSEPPAPSSTSSSSSSSESPIESPPVSSDVAEESTSSLPVTVPSQSDDAPPTVTDSSAGHLSLGLWTLVAPMVALFFL